MDTKETRRRMKSGQLYYCTDPEVSADQARCNEIVYDYNQTRPSQSQLRQEILKKLLGDLGENCYVEPPLREMCIRDSPWTSLWGKICTIPEFPRRTCLPTALGCCTASPSRW